MIVNTLCKLLGAPNLTDDQKKVIGKNINNSFKSQFRGQKPNKVKVKDGYMVCDYESDWMIFCGGRCLVRYLRMRKRPELAEVFKNRIRIMQEREEKAKKAKRLEARSRKTK